MTVPFALEVRIGNTNPRRYYQYLECRPKQAPNGKEIRVFKDQLGRLSAAIIRMEVSADNQAFQVDLKIVTAFDLWFSRNEQQ